MSTYQKANAYPMSRVHMKMTAILNSLSLDLVNFPMPMNLIHFLILLRSSIRKNLYLSTKFSQSITQSFGSLAKYNLHEPSHNLTDGYRCVLILFRATRLLYLSSFSFFTPHNKNGKDLINEAPWNGASQQRGRNFSKIMVLLACVRMITLKKQ